MLAAFRLRLSWFSSLALRKIVIFKILVIDGGGEF